MGLTEDKYQEKAESMKLPMSSVKLEGNSLEKVKYAYIM